jgi:hypothetical protein
MLGMVEAHRGCTQACILLLLGLSPAQRLLSPCSLCFGCVALQLHAGDTVRWRCSYNMSGLQPGSGLTGGYSSTPAVHQEQCTVSLHYWPRVDSMRGCTAALDDDVLLGENVCSSEAEDVVALKAVADSQLPIK